MNISYNFGMVDLVHFGHMRSIKKAAENADLMVFGLVSDEAADAWFGSHISNESERTEVIKGIRYVDRVISQKTFDPLENLKSLHNEFPEAVITLFHGDEWGLLSAKRFIESIGGKTVKLDYYEKLSLSRIAESISKRQTTADVSRNNFISTKASTLLYLKDILQKSQIEDSYIVNVGEYKYTHDTIVREVQEYFKCGKLVVRSSSKREDAFETSNAGHFLSVLDVDCSEFTSVDDAIKSVIASYGEGIENDEQVLIQRQTDGVLISGVVFTRDIQRNRPYYVINFDDNGSTDSVTSGMSNKTTWIYHDTAREEVPSKWFKLMESVWEIEDTFPGVLLDIEFAITKSQVIIFQVRPLAAAYKYADVSDKKDFVFARDKVIEKYDGLSRCELSLFSDMAFWNPSEIIGDNPKSLDYSLYRYIITHDAWDGITSLGYRHTDGDLMFRFGNKPYISVEKSFKALTPQDISEELNRKLQAYYAERFIKDPSSHDKIEFEIVLNTFDFSLDSRLEKLKKAEFGDAEIDELDKSLRDITENVISDYDIILEDDLSDLNKLEEIRLDIQNIIKKNTDIRSIAKSVQTLLDAISTYGTPQFSRQARCAFIAKSLCNSLLKEGYVLSDEYNRFISSIRTIAVEYDEDLSKVETGEMTYTGFLHKYGHLRAGTYNIRIPRYDQMGDMLFAQRENEERNNKAGADTDNNGVSEDIDKIIEFAITRAQNDSGFTLVEADRIVKFIRQATAQREYFKLIFSKSLSFALELIATMGRMVGISRKDLSYLELQEIFSAQFYENNGKLAEYWMLLINRRKEIFATNSELILPSIITSSVDFDIIEPVNIRPNFITDNKVLAETIVLGNDDMNTKDDIEGKVVCVEQADPGFDWIFSKNIAGLVTKFGGAASHMAIRCAEFNLPAVIGCGGDMFDTIIDAKKVLLDCKHEKIEVYRG